MNVIVMNSHSNSATVVANILDPEDILGLYRRRYFDGDDPLLASLQAEDIESIMLRINTGFNAPNGRVVYSDLPTFHLNQYRNSTEETVDDLVAFLTTQEIPFSVWSVSDDSHDTDISVSVFQGSDDDLLLSLRGCQLCGVLVSRPKSEFMEKLEPRVRGLLERLNIAYEATTEWVEW